MALGLLVRVAEDRHGANSAYEAVAVAVAVSVLFALVMFGVDGFAVTTLQQCKLSFSLFFSFDARLRAWIRTANGQHINDMMGALLLEL